LGFYSEYVDRSLSFADLAKERQIQLARISGIRGRDIIVFAADLSKGSAPISITYSDLLPIADQLSNLKGTERIDLLLETPGGSGEVAEDIVRKLHDQYKEVGIIVPGWAKSAGTIVAMAGDEILMEPSSALGPIDAQLSWQGKVFSADALIEGMEKIKKEVEATNTLNRAYIPVLQGISPGELQAAENALKFAKVLVTDWLARYKFKNWLVHSSTGLPVSESDRKNRAEEIATTLCDHRRWLTHGRSLQLADLEKMRLRVTNYALAGPLAEAIRRYYALMQMTFAGTGVYKLFETPSTAIYRFLAQPVAPPQEPGAMTIDVALLDVRCSKCSRIWKVQANLETAKPLQNGALAYPADDNFKCPSCGADTILAEAKRQIEAQTKKRVVL